MTISFNSPDWGKAGHALGVTSGIAMVMQTDAYISDLVGDAARYASKEMGREIDKKARVDKTLSHVYEWRTPGIEAGRLFAIYPVGRGRNRIIDFNLLASKTPVPTIEEREAAGSIAALPDRVKKNLSRTNSKKYIFRQKAEYMEYGGSLTIRPKGNHKLFIPLKETLANGRSYVFANSANVSFAHSKFRGRFHAEFQLAQQEVGRKAVAKIEQESDLKTRTVAVRAGRSSAKTFSIGFSQGQNYARNRMRIANKEEGPVYE